MCRILTITVRIVLPYVKQKFKFRQTEMKLEESQFVNDNVNVTFTLFFILNISSFGTHL